MKIRLGFVTNSSSSSFIVMTRDRYSMFEDESERFAITDKEKEELLKAGFQPSNQIHASSIDVLGYINRDLIKADIKDACSLYKCCSCNQEDIAYFLLKQGIPFTASVHYGHETWYFERGSEFFYKLRNLGIEYEMYKEVSVGKKWDEPVLEKINVKKWLKQHKNDMKAYAKMEKESLKSIEKKIEQMKKE